MNKGSWSHLTVCPTCIDIRVYTPTQIYTCTWLYTQMCVCIHMDTHGYMSTYKYTHMHTHAYMPKHICLHTEVHTGVCVYTYKHMRICPHTEKCTHIAVYRYARYRQSLHVNSPFEWNEPFSGSSWSLGFCYWSITAVTIGREGGSLGTGSSFLLWIPHLPHWTACWGR